MRGLFNNWPCFQKCIHGVAFIFVGNVTALDHLCQSDWQTLKWSCIYLHFIEQVSVVVCVFFSKLPTKYTNKKTKSKTLTNALSLYFLFKIFLIQCISIIFLPLFPFSSQILPISIPTHPALCSLSQNKSKPQNTRMRIKQTNKAENKKTKWKKSLYRKKHGVHFMFANYSWVWDLRWGLLGILSDTPL